MALINAGANGSGGRGDLSVDAFSRELSVQNETPPDLVVPWLCPDAFVTVQLNAEQPVLQNDQQYICLLPD